MPGPISRLDIQVVTFVIPGEDGDIAGNMRPVNEGAVPVYQSAAKAHAQPRTHLEMIQTIAPTRNGFAIAQKAILEAAARPRIAYKAIDVNAQRRELVAIISRSGFTDSQGDVVERAALAKACSALAERGFGTVAIDRNHRTPLNDVTLEKAFMGSAALPPPYSDPDCLYGIFSFANPSATWDACKANRCVGMSWAGPFSR